MNNGWQSTPDYFLVHDKSLALIAAAASAFLSGTTAESRNSFKREKCWERKFIGNN
jgi:hypothetical protein